MKFLIDLISEQLAGAFERAGFDAAYGKATLSNRPDLCEYQCNGALAAAKQYHKAPIQIANAVLDALGKNEMFSSAEAVMPGFLNLKISEDYLASYLREMAQTPHYGAQDDPNACTIVLDYGGPNVAKPLHVGHLRSAIIGESLKRIYRFFGNHVIGDIHLGDWGLQMGLIMAQLRMKSRAFRTLTRTTPANTPPKRRSRSPSLNAFTLPPAPAARRAKPSPPARMRRPSASSTANAASAHSGSISCACPLKTSSATMTISA